MRSKRNDCAMADEPASGFEQTLIDPGALCVEIVAIWCALSLTASWTMSVTMAAVSVAASERREKRATVQDEGPSRQVKDLRCQRDLHGLVPWFVPKAATRSHRLRWAKLS
jgi:hypothetical protein